MKCIIKVDEVILMSYFILNAGSTWQMLNCIASITTFIVNSLKILRKTLKIVFLMILTFAIQNKKIYKN